MNAWVVFVAYQLVWFAAVIGAGHGLAWPGAVAAITFVVWQLLRRAARGQALLMVTLGIVLGLLVDGGAAMAGLLHYAAADRALPAGGAPLWILGLWACFALTFEQSLAFLCRRPWLALAFGAVGGPLAYWGAQRGWQAVQFGTPLWAPLLWLAVGWALATSMFAWTLRRLQPQLASNTGKRGETL
ncbi:DUF2878 domain-containing protein [Stenotrophomonas sp. YIM B06876]|uniref:DUF2878 domain-containing protein n=1 Tax=Stenotrophomonas sp. YIM B06876 TaxID=3060211 RepID=UPI002739464D|nr:DUF2878 domain-containing protein [Stenotrophomonas sp. YIM B06876]